MNIVAIFLVFLLSKVVGMDATELIGTASRIDGEGNEFSIQIDYETKYKVELGVGKGKILQQRIVRFYDGAKHLGSYYYWQEYGSGLPDATTSRDFEVKPAKFTEVRITDRFYDVNWRDGRWTEKELGTWYNQTWHFFNSWNRKMSGSGYYLCEIEEIPRMDGYLKGFGFTVYAVLEHSFTLHNNAANIQAEQVGTGQPATRPESKSEGDAKPQPEVEGLSR
jgi:hypothetical protein